MSVVGEVSMGEDVTWKCFVSSANTGVEGDRKRIPDNALILVM
jgi:hypothetical protein